MTEESDRSPSMSGGGAAPGHRTHLTRRQFLGYAGAGSALMVLGDGLLLGALSAPNEVAAVPVTMTRTARRREDFLSLRLEFRNLVLSGTSPRRLVKANSKQAAYLVAVFPPQHLADEARILSQLKPAGDTMAMLAGATRLAFEVPGALLPMPFDIESLLRWSLFPLRVPTAAQNISPPSSLGSLKAPSPDQTAIELPWFLLLSPRPDAGWAHAPAPVTRGSRTELWHTRLGTRKPGPFFGIPIVDEQDAAKRTVRAVWARDEGFPNVTEESEAAPKFSLNRIQRKDIVAATSVGSVRQPVQVNRMMLSTLGGWLDSRGVWSTGPVEEWVHRAVMGRDSYVRIVERGYLMPFGHRAAKITISERQFQRPAGQPGHPLGAYLVQRQFVVVREPLKEFGYAKAKYQPADGRGFPFRSVRMRTLTTPLLRPRSSSIYFLQPESAPQNPAPPAYPDPATCIMFDLVGVDWEGQATEFSAPLMWVREDAVFAVDPPADPDEDPVTPLMPAGLADKYSLAPKQFRTVAVQAQKVAFAPAKVGGDTTFAVEELVLQAQGLANDLFNTVKGELQAAQLPPVYPRLESALAQLTATAETTGQAVKDLIPIRIDPGFVDFGFPGLPMPDLDEVYDTAQELLDHQLKNAGEMLLDVAKDLIPPDLLPKVDFGDVVKAGGLATPNFDVTGFTRDLGPVGGIVDDLRKGDFKPEKIFDIASAKLLGQLKLGDILKGVDDGINGLLGNGPTIQNLVDPKPPGIPKKLITRLDWSPKLRPDPLKIFIPQATASLTIKAEAVTDLVNTGASTFSVEGLLRDVELHLIGDSKFIIIEVKSIRFTTGKDKAPDVDPQLGEIRFTGALTFVEEMRNFLSSLGKGFGVDVQPTGISASLSLPLPSISIGVFTLQNLSIGIGAEIPFTGKAARFRFSFCSRENPFILTVSMFGGGGFLALECGTDKSVMLEIALEFGAAVAFDIVVASGGVEIMAGIYIKIQNDDALLSGYLRAAGELSILGIIRISCELYLGFEYHTQSDKCIGEAKFYLEIEILFITIPVKAQVRRAFGGEGDPTFAQLMGGSDWTDYCNAFAPLGTP